MAMEETPYGRKVFLGGLPVTTTIAELHANFDRFGPLLVDWPHKESYEVMPPNRYAFLIFANYDSVNYLMSLCGPSDFNNYVIDHDGKKCIISVKPWERRNNEAVLNPSWKHYERYSIFVGGIHRRSTAGELANTINEAIGGVVYVGMEIDEETDYPKGAARVVFSNPASYIKAIGTRQIITVMNGYDRIIELKPYVLDYMRCETCLNAASRYFCPEIRCLKYFCEMCWPISHLQPGLSGHVPMDKENLHLATPNKNKPRFDKLGWSPLKLSLSSPIKVSSPTLSDLLVFNELKLEDTFSPTTPSKFMMQGGGFQTPKKSPFHSPGGFMSPLTPTRSYIASPMKLKLERSPAFEFGPFKPEVGKAE